MSIIKRVKPTFVDSNGDECHALDAGNFIGSINAINLIINMAIGEAKKLPDLHFDTHAIESKFAIDSIIKKSFDNAKNLPDLQSRVEFQDSFDVKITASFDSKATSLDKENDKIFCIEVALRSNPKAKIQHRYTYIDFLRIFTSKYGYMYLPQTYLMNLLITFRKINAISPKEHILLRREHDVKLSREEFKKSCSGLFEKLYHNATCTLCNEIYEYDVRFKCNNDKCDTKLCYACSSSIFKPDEKVRLPNMYKCPYCTTYMKDLAGDCLIDKEYERLLAEYKVIEDNNKDYYARCDNCQQMKLYQTKECANENVPSLKVFYCDDCTLEHKMSCPTCKVPVYKISGCNHIDCPSCRENGDITHFCYVCGFKGEHEEVYDHMNNSHNGWYGNVISIDSFKRKEALDFTYTVNDKFSIDNEITKQCNICYK